jgi:hypothetical protein
MTAFEPSKAFIDQETFVAAADGLLEKAQSPDTEIAGAVEAAQDVLVQLGNIAAEKLVVQPPLSEEQVSNYSKTATTIVGIGQKALGSLETAGAQRETSKAGDTVQAKGDEAKSSVKPKPTPAPKPKPSTPSASTDPQPPKRRGRPPKNPQ